MKPHITDGPRQRSLAEIEYEVRRLRAETLAAAGAALRRAVVRFFTRRQSGGSPANV